ncbi:MAG TPA: RNase adapter RapZ [Eubacterium sp.]|nr:RNase adapter RapZ [Eubacterium sp.]HBZ52780.1 RNase adapter RapZ [Eubacterium sp.]
MYIVIVTGMSGAGKTTVLKQLEDLDFFCIDNMPVVLADKVITLAGDNDGCEKMAFGVDIRSTPNIEELLECVKSIRDVGHHVDILFLDATDETIIHRYKETRRKHPLAQRGRTIDGVTKEREKLAIIKSNATHIVDTSHLLVRDLKKKITDIFVEGKAYSNFYISFMSFGFKYGIPDDADLVFDVRFLPNPYYVDNLKYLTGEDQEVRDYVMADGNGEIFLGKLKDMLDFLIPQYIGEGKNQLVIAVGCTGGKHRSVTLARGLHELYKDTIYDTGIYHRDIRKAWN